MQDKILTPLEMHDTGFDHPDQVIKNRAAGYYKFGRTFRNANFIDMSIAYAAGGMYSTVEDLYRWDQALYTEKLLPRKYLDLIFEKHAPIYGRHYGYGWEIGQMGKGWSGELVPVVNHSGVINGFHTLITRIPEDKSSILLLSNAGGAPLFEMSRAISGILYEKPYKFPRKSLAYSLLEALEKDGWAQARLFFEQNKDSDSYYLNEHEMNMAGYHLLESGKAADAAAVFKQNIKAFPKSANAYDSYGEALMVLGNRDKAIENYEKSIELNPGNTHGIEMLRKLRKE